MKVFIVYASAGAGHFKAAQAIYNYLKDNYKEIDSELIDVLDETNALFRLNYSWGYSWLIKYTPFLWQWAFWITYNKALRIFTRPIARLVSQLNTKNFSQVLIRENPTFIISTHFLPSEIATELKNSKKIDSKVITVITDLGVHPFWIAAGTDFYVVASSLTKKLLLCEGVEENKIKEFGIPIDSKFIKDYPKDELRDRFNIDKNKFTVLIVTGSYGIGPIREIVDLLYKYVQILVVCARNKRLYAYLKAKDYQNVKVFGFIDNIQELMVVSSMIVTKPGGLSISELLAMELVPVFISPIPGQETTNIEVLKSYGVGIRADKAEDIKKIVLYYKEHQDKLNSVRESIRKIKKPYAAGELCDAVCKGSSGLSD
jgi:processive 1,2-diacylglycerol beta-glucosyltransferase